MIGTGSTPGTDLNWLVDDLTRRVMGVAHAVVVSSDGLPLVRSSALPPEASDQISAIASGLSSLTVGAAQLLDGGEVTQTIVEMGRGFLFVSSISDGSLLAVIATAAADLGQVGYEIAVLVERVGPALTPELRRELSGSVAGG